MYNPTGASRSPAARGRDYYYYYYYYNYYNYYYNYYNYYNYYYYYCYYYYYYYDYYYYHYRGRVRASTRVTDLSPGLSTCTPVCVCVCNL